MVINFNKLSFLLVLMFSIAMQTAGCMQYPEKQKVTRYIPPGEYTVVSIQDDLSSLSLRAYGDQELWYCLLNANPKLCSRPDFKLELGEVVVIPEKNDLDKSLPKSIFPDTLPADYIVMPGDSLHFIAANCYGDKEKWEIIYDANRSSLSEKVKRDTRQLMAGQVLHIPELQETSGQVEKD